jgi:hypothetical protein
VRVKHAIAALLLALAAWLVSGCREAEQLVAVAPASAVPIPAEVAQLVWVETYGRTDAPPLVEWREGAALDCDGGTGFMTSFGCADGQFFGPYIAVARRPNEPLADSAIAHELGHAAQWRAEGVHDVDHRGPWFAPGGPVARAEAELRKLERRPEAGLLPAAVRRCRLAAEHPLDQGSAPAR